ncbi:hypothetical protein IV102_22460, partial [bacterium]|nr:hypothetical protein [bacterium]
MKTHRLLALLACTLTAAAQPPQLKHPEFLKEYAQSRGYLLGRPVKPKVTPQG